MGFGIPTTFRAGRKKVVRYRKQQRRAPSPAQAVSNFGTAVGQGVNRAAPRATKVAQSKRPRTAPRPPTGPTVRAVRKGTTGRATVQHTTRSQARVRQSSKPGLKRYRFVQPSSGVERPTVDVRTPEKKAKDRTAAKRLKASGPKAPPKVKAKRDQTQLRHAIDKFRFDTPIKAQAQIAFAPKPKARKVAFKQGFSSKTFPTIRRRHRKYIAKRERQRQDYQRKRKAGKLPTVRSEHDSTTKAHPFQSYVERFISRLEGERQAKRMLKETRGIRNPDTGAVVTGVHFNRRTGQVKPVMSPDERAWHERTWDNTKRRVKDLPHAAPTIVKDLGTAFGELAISAPRAAYETPENLIQGKSPFNSKDRRDFMREVTPTISKLEEGVEKDDPVYGFFEEGFKGGLKAGLKEAGRRAERDPLTAAGWLALGAGKGASAALKTGRHGGAVTKAFKGAKGGRAKAAFKAYKLGEARARARPDRVVVDATSPRAGRQARGDLKDARSRRRLHAQELAKARFVGDTERAARLAQPARGQRGSKQRAYARNELIRAAQKSVERARASVGIDPDTYGKRGGRRREKREVQREIQFNEAGSQRSEAVTDHRVDVAIRRAKPKGPMEEAAIKLVYADAVRTRDGLAAAKQDLDKVEKWLGDELARTEAPDVADRIADNIERVRAIKADVAKKGGRAYIMRRKTNEAARAAAAESQRIGLDAELLELITGSQRTLRSAAPAHVMRGEIRHEQERPGRTPRDEPPAAAPLEESLRQSQRSIEEPVSTPGARPRQDGPELDEFIKEKAAQVIRAPSSEKRGHVEEMIAKLPEAQQGPFRDRLDTDDLSDVAQDLERAVLHRSPVAKRQVTPDPQGPSPKRGRQAVATPKREPSGEPEPEAAVHAVLDDELRQLQRKVALDKEGDQSVFLKSEARKLYRKIERELPVDQRRALKDDMKVDEILDAAKRQVAKAAKVNNPPANVPPGSARERSVKRLKEAVGTQKSERNDPAVARREEGRLDDKEKVVDQERSDIAALRRDPRYAEAEQAYLDASENLARLEANESTPQERVAAARERVERARNELHRERRRVGGPRRSDSGSEVGRRNDDAGFYETTGARRRVTTEPARTGSRVQIEQNTVAGIEFRNADARTREHGALVELGQGYTGRSLAETPLNLDGIRGLGEQQRRIGMATLTRSMLERSLRGEHFDLDDAQNLAEKQSALTGDKWVTMRFDHHGQERYLVLPQVTEKVFARQLDNKPSFTNAGQLMHRWFVASVLPFSPLWWAGNVMDMMLRVGIAGNGALLRDRAAYTALRGRLVKEVGEARANQILSLFEGHFGTRRRTPVPRLDSLSKRFAPISDSMRTGLLGTLTKPLVETREFLFDVPTKTERFFTEAAVGRAFRDHAGQLGYDTKTARLKRPKAAAAATKGRTLRDPRSYELQLQGAVHAYREHLTEAVIDTSRWIDRYSDELAHSLPHQEELARRVFEITGDYTSTPFQRKWVDPAVPFWQWMKAAHKLVFYTLPVKHPLKTLGLVMAARMTEEERRKAGLSHFISAKEASMLGPMFGWPTRQTERTSFFRGAWAAGGGVIPTVPFFSFGEASGWLPEDTSVQGMFGPVIEYLTAKPAPFVTKPLANAMGWRSPADRARQLVDPEHQYELIGVSPGMKAAISTAEAMGGPFGQAHRVAAGGVPADQSTPWDPLPVFGTRRDPQLGVLNPFDVVRPFGEPRPEVFNHPRLKGRSEAIDKAAETPFPGANRAMAKGVSRETEGVKRETRDYARERKRKARRTTLQKLIAGRGNGIVDVPHWLGEMNEEIAEWVLPVMEHYGKKYDLKITDAFDRDRSAGHSSAGHNATGTAVDIVPKNGDWSKVNEFVGEMTDMGLTVLYDGQMGSTAYAGHGEGHHAHVQFDRPTVENAGKKIEAAPASTGPQDKFAKRLLNRLQIKPNKENTTFLRAWMQAEGGHWNNTARHNPLNTTWEKPGSSTMNSHGVRVYGSWKDGYDATVQTLQNGMYDGILDAMRNGTAKDAADALAASPWGTGALVQQILNAGGPSSTAIASGGAGSAAPPRRAPSGVTPSSAPAGPGAAAPQAAPYDMHVLRELLAQIEAGQAPAGRARFRRPRRSASRYMLRGR